MNLPALQFTEVLTYATRAEGITLPVTLHSGELACDTHAKFDPGAQVCLFSREIGEYLNLDIERGTPIVLGSSIVQGRLHAFGHEITMQVGNIALPLTVYFSRDYGMPNFIGRQGWLPRMVVGLVDYEQKIYLALYDADGAFTLA